MERRGLRDLVVAPWIRAACLHWGNQSRRETSPKGTGTRPTYASRELGVAEFSPVPLPAFHSLSRTCPPFLSLRQMEGTAGIRRSCASYVEFFTCAAQSGLSKLENVALSVDQRRIFCICLAKAIFIAVCMKLIQRHFLFRCFNFIVASQTNFIKGTLSL